VLHGARKTVSGSSVPIGRAYRRIVFGSRRTYGASFLFIVTVQSMMFFSMNVVAAVYTNVAVFALAQSGFAVREGRAPFSSMSLPIAVVAVPPPRTTDLLICMTIGIVVIAAFYVLPHPMPIRHVVVAAALILIASAIQILLMGRPSYEPSDFSSIWLRTSLMTWGLSPALLGVVSFLFPFNVRERVKLLSLVVGLGFAFSIMRYAVVLAILSIVGSVVLPLLFIFAGPLLDAIIYVCIFSWSLVSLSVRLHKSPEVWRWSLH
jgi:hypothetical protein